MQKLVECVEQESLKYEVFFKLIISTGMRRGECCGIKWSDINWQEYSIKISRNIVKVSHEDILEKEPKTAAGNRKVYISKSMDMLLGEFRSECEWFARQYIGRELHDGDFIFIRDNSLPMTPNSFTFRFNKILAKHDLPKTLTVHSLRHSNASLLISQNVDVRTVAGLLGHSQASTTLDIYSHSFDKTKKAASEKLGAVLDI